ncbi:MAG: hypothetical protein ACR2NU_08395 [Aeoliella sp.]
MPSSFDPDEQGLMYGYNIARMDFPEVNVLGMNVTFGDLAKAAGVRPISEYLDYSEMVNPGNEIDGLPLVEPKWFSIEDGLASVNGVLNELVKHDADEGLLWDLQVSQSILQSAAESGERFHFEVL